MMILSVDNSGLQFVALLNLYAVFTTAYGAMLSHEQRSRRCLEFSNLSMVQLLSYTMASMTQFCPDQETLYDISFIFIAIICLIAFINLSYIGCTIYKKVERDKKMKKYEERFITFIEA